MTSIAARFLGGLCLWSLAVSVLAAASVESAMALKAEIVDFGVYELLQRGQPQFKADSTAGYHSQINSRLIAQHDRIELQEGLVFGLNFRVRDTAGSAEWLPLTIEFSHPQTFDFLGQESLGFSQQTAARLRADGYYHNGAFYIFSEPNEMLPGPWQIRILHRGETLLSKSFEVVLD